MNNTLHIISKNILSLSLGHTDELSVEPSWLKYFTKRILVKDRNIVRVIPLSDIIYLQSQSNYTYIHTFHHKILHSRTLKYWCDQIAHDYFHRVHHSYLINKMYIDSISKSENTMVLTNGIIVPIARRYNGLDGVFTDSGLLSMS